VQLTDLIEPGDVVIGARSTTVGLAAADILRATLPRRGFSSADVERFVAAVLEREREAPTLCGAIAIPHARDPQLQQFVAAIGINPAGIIDGPGAPRVLIVFLSPDAKRSEHLALLASLARLGRDTTLVASLAAASTAEDVVRLLHAPKS
jgi:mannitol/fructose-specific phosphotransferase system IIA component (Ntr-type)